MVRTQREKWTRFQEKKSTVHIHIDGQITTKIYFGHHGHVISVKVMTYPLINHHYPSHYVKKERERVLLDPYILSLKKT